MLVISEQEKKEILKKYQNDTSDELLTYLKRHFPTGETHLKGWEPAKYIVVDDKIHYLKSNKKYLVGKLSGILEDEWIHLGDQVIRRTVKKYIDGVSL